MQEPSSMWREELWHPLSVHYPIALLGISGIIGVLYVLLRRRKVGMRLRFSFSLLLYLGVLFFWLAFYTGQLAYSIEVRRLCDPTVVKDHLYWAYITGYLFSAAVVLDIVSRFSRNSRRWFLIGSIILSLGGALVLAYVGHLGAKLVYQQAAGVYQPTEDCREFE